MGASEWRQVPDPRLSPILTAALDAFYENGFHGTSVRDLAARVGVTVPALYYHHRNKEAILVALLDLGTQGFLDRARAALDDAGDDPATRLSFVVESIVLGVARQPRLSALESEIRYLSAQDRERISAVRAELEGLVHAVIADGRDRGEFVVDDVAEATRAILGMCQWVAHWYRPDGAATPEDLASRYARIALSVVGRS